MIKMKITYCFSVLIPLLLLTSCGGKYKIEGTSSVTSLDGKMLFLRTLQENQWVTIDSAEVIHGLFSMHGETDSVMMTTLYMGEEAIMPIILESGKIEILISNSQLVAKGTPLNNSLYEFIEKRNAFEVRLEELERRESRMVLDGGELDEIRAQLNQEGEALMEEMNTYIKDFICSNYENILGPGVFMMMCNTLPYPIMTPTIEDIIRVAPQTFKSNRMVREFLDKAKENKQLIEEYRRMEDSGITQ